MTSSSLATQPDYSAEIEAVTLDSKTTKGLSQPDIAFIKERVFYVNQALETAGKAYQVGMENLVQIKQNIKKTNWTALTDSGAFNMSGRMARDYATAWETWLRDSGIPESCYAKVSSRTLAKIGAAEPGKRIHAINKIKKGDGFTEKDLAQIISKAKTPLRRQIDDLVDQAELKTKRTSEADKVKQYGQLVVENLRLKAKVEDLEFKLDRANKALVTATGMKTTKNARSRSKAAV